MYSKVLSGVVQGIDGRMIEVEADVSDGLPAFTLVGLPASEVRESGERVRNALSNCNFILSAKRVTVNLSPADVKKAGTGFDLPIAVALLTAYGLLPESAGRDTAFFGELGLDGAVKPINGVLPLVDAAAGAGVKTCYVPRGNLPEARLVEGISCYGIAHLREFLACYDNPQGLADVPPMPQQETFCDMLDFADMRGQPLLKRAVTVCAAGMHNVLIAGPPGSGKSMIAKRIPSIMPELTYEESMLLTRIYSASGLTANQTKLISTRPFRSPHHTASTYALIGGGMTPKPGEITLAHSGVLFLDEFPEFSKKVIEVLRQPMEDRTVTVSRLKSTVTFPADFMLVAAMNLCPCGYYPDRNKCSCRDNERQRYLGKISKPILDRIDVHILVEPVSYQALSGTEKETSSSELRAIVKRAHDVQHERYREDGILFNSQLEGRLIKRYVPLTQACQSLLETAFDKLNLSARAGERVLRVCRTIADLEGSEHVREEHMMEALSYREIKF